MGSIRNWALAIGAFMLLIPAAAIAADMPGPPPAPSPGPFARAPFEFGSGWYLRGDIGYKFYNAPDAHFDVAGYGNMINESLTDTGVVGLGLGYKFNQWLRTDLTVDYEWPGHFHGNLNCPTLGCLPGPTYSDEYADISAWTGLVNAYVDLGTWGGFTPYVGAGIGTSYLSTSNVHYVNPDASTGTWGGASKWNLAWALMAGVSYNISPKWLLDLNYRYVNLGDAISGPTTFGGQPIHYDNISAQEIRLGFRYMIN